MPKKKKNTRQKQAAKSRTVRNNRINFLRGALEDLEALSATPDKRPARPIKGIN